MKAIPVYTVPTREERDSIEVIFHNEQVTITIFSSASFFCSILMVNYFDLVYGTRIHEQIKFYKPKIKEGGVYGLCNFSVHNISSVQDHKAPISVCILHGHKQYDSSSSSYPFPNFMFNFHTFDSVQAQPSLNDKVLIGNTSTQTLLHFFIQICQSWMDGSPRQVVQGTPQRLLTLTLEDFV